MTFWKFRLLLSVLANFLATKVIFIRRILVYQSYKFVDNNIERKKYIIVNTELLIKS